MTSINLNDPIPGLPGKAQKSENEIQHLNLFLDKVPAAIYTCDRQGFITAFNKAAVNLWGREPEIGKDLWCGSWKIFTPEGNSLSLDKCPMALALKERDSDRRRRDFDSTP